MSDYKEEDGDLGSQALISLSNPIYGVIISTPPSQFQHYNTTVRALRSLLFGLVQGLPGRPLPSYLSLAVESCAALTANNLIDNSLRCIVLSFQGECLYSLGETEGAIEAAQASQAIYKLIPAPLPGEVEAREAYNTVLLDHLLASGPQPAVTSTDFIDALHIRLFRYE